MNILYTLVKLKGHSGQQPLRYEFEWSDMHKQSVLTLSETEGERGAEAGGSGVKGLSRCDSSEGFHWTKRFHWPPSNAELRLTPLLCSTGREKLCL